MREQRNDYSILVGKPAVKRPLGRHRCKWKSIKGATIATGWDSVGWIHLQSFD
jgi:hypothetical protein